MPNTQSERTMNEFYTFRQIRDALNELSEEQLDMTASVYDPDIHEVFPIRECFIVENMSKEHQERLDGVVENDQPLLVLLGSKDICPA